MIDKNTITIQLTLEDIPQKTNEESINANE